MRHTAARDEHIAVGLKGNFDLHAIGEVFVARAEPLTQPSFDRGDAAKELARILSRVRAEISVVRTRLTSGQSFDFDTDRPAPRVGHRTFAYGDLVVAGLVGIAIKNHPAGTALLLSRRPNQHAARRAARVDLDT